MAVEDLSAHLLALTSSSQIRRVISKYVATTVLDFIIATLQNTSWIPPLNNFSMMTCLQHYTDRISNISWNIVRVFYGIFSILFNSSLHHSHGNNNRKVQTYILTQRHDFM